MRNITYLGLVIVVMMLVIGAFFFVKANNQEEGGLVLLPLKKAIIYPKKSHFFHHFSVNLKKGDTILYLQNIAKGIDTNSISLKGFDENIHFTIGYAKNTKVFPKNHIIHALRDSIFFLKDTLENIQFAQNTLQKGQEFLKTNVPTSLEHFSKEKIQELYHFLQQKDIENQKQKRVLHRTAKYLHDKLTKIEEKIAFYESSSENQAVMLALKIHAKTDFFGELALTYHTNRIYWTPSYKINISEKDSLIKMDFLGKITQKSGVIFQKTTTFLATKDISEQDFSREKYISIVPDSIFRKKNKILEKNTEANENMLYPAWKHEILLTLSAKLDTSITFFSQKARKKYILQVQPSIHQEAQKVIKWENWVFNGALPAKADILVENQPSESIFVGLNQQNLYFAISNDKRIQSQYKPFLEKEKEVFAQKNEKSQKDTSKLDAYSALQKYSQGFEAEIVNTSKDTLMVEVLEKLPILQHEHLKMDFPQKNQNFITEQGVFLWQFSLKPNEKQKVQANWILSFPKNYVLEMQ